MQQKKMSEMLHFSFPPQALQYCRLCADLLPNRCEGARQWRNPCLCADTFYALLPPSSNTRDSKKGKPLQSCIEKTHRIHRTPGKSWKIHENPLKSTSHLLMIWMFMDLVDIPEKISWKIPNWSGGALPMTQGPLFIYDASRHALGTEEVAPGSHCDADEFQSGARGTFGHGTWLNMVENGGFMGFDGILWDITMI